MLRAIAEIRRRAIVGAVLPFLAVTALGLGGCTNAMEEKSMDESRFEFVLVAVDEAPAVGAVQPLLILSGHGNFTADWVEATGKYTLADAATEVPKAILSRGDWVATDVVRWTPAADGATYGHVYPGTIDLRVNLTASDGTVIEGALLRINCNVGLAGIKNSDPDTGAELAEGYWLTVPPGAAFGGITGIGSFVPRDPILGVTEITG